MLLNNPVLQRELLVNLRTLRAFVLLAVYVGLLGVVVYIAWPTRPTLDLTRRSQEAQQLVGLFFFGQYLLTSLLAPSFAAGTFTGEKERATYEMLLASPLRPSAIVLGKLLAALCHVGVLVFASLPIVMLCLALGGVSPYEVLATYAAMSASVVLSGMISIRASSHFTRTASALVVSYLIILPTALLGAMLYSVTAGLWRIVLLGGFFPAVCMAVTAVLFVQTARRLLHPPDLGAEARDMLDPDQEQKTAVGMVIHSDQFPDRLFAPAKRTGLLADGVNPIFDKELRSELFGQGTLMMRLVIQLSMFLALPLMAVCLYIWPAGTPWYIGYVVLFNVLVGPVFSAGSITSERERQTLELLLTTTVSPGQILAGKLFSGLRVSMILTSFLVWPLVLAWVLPPWVFWYDTATVLWYIVIILLTSLTTTTIAMFCSVVSEKTSVSLMTTYLIVGLLFAVPVVAWLFGLTFSPAVQGLAAHTRPATVEDPYTWLQWSTVVSPLATAFSLPLALGQSPESVPPGVWWRAPVVFVAFYALLDLVLLLSMHWLFARRWRVWS